MVDKETLARDVFRHELKAGEKVRRLFSEFDESDGEDAMILAFEELMDNVDSEQNAQSIASLMERFARQMGSKEMLEVVVSRAEQSEHLEVEKQDG